MNVNTDPNMGKSTAAVAGSASFGVVLALSAGHFLNDTMQSMISAIYPMIKENYGLTFTQIGLLGFAFQFTGSILQPIVGLYTDKRPVGYSLPVGMGFTLIGLLMLAGAGHYWLLVVAACMVGVGSSIFHPESSRIARLASGGRHGTAQSVFQLGGNFGTAVGPLLAAFIVVPMGQSSVAWFALAALIGIVILTWVSRWYGEWRRAAASRPKPNAVPLRDRKQVRAAIAVLLLLIFSKFVYTSSLSNYYTFFVIDKFGLEIQQAQIMLFLYLGAVAFGTLIGGPIGDRIGARTVIWVSILGILPFTLMLPYANLFWTGVLSVIIGTTLASAFPAIIVFAQELVPGRVGAVAGMFFGFAFGMGGIAAAVLGQVADIWGIETVYKVCSFLPIIGLCAVLLPKNVR